MYEKTDLDVVIPSKLVAPVNVHNSDVCIAAS